MDDAIIKVSTDTMSGSIRIVLEYDNDNAFFHVKDTGVGIPQAGEFISNKVLSTLIQ